MSPSLFYDLVEMENAELQRREDEQDHMDLMIGAKGWQQGQYQLR